MKVITINANKLQEVGDIDKELENQYSEFNKPESNFVTGQLTPEFVLKCLKDNEDGDARLFVALNRGMLVFDHSLNNWFKWNNNVWQEDSIDESLDAIQRVIDIYEKEGRDQALLKIKATRCGNSSKAAEHAANEKEILMRIKQLQTIFRKKNVLGIARIGGSGLGIKGNEWDTDPWVFGVQNGIIDLHTGRFRQGEVGDYIRTSSPVVWKGLNHPAPIWETTLLQIFNSDKQMVLFVQRLFGYCLTGLTTEPVYPILWGKGRNGKGVLIETFASVLGGYAGPVEAEIVLKQKMTRNSGGPTSDIMALRGKRLVWSSEIEEGRRLDAAKVKWLTGNDSLTGRPMYGKNQIDFRPTHKLILLTNHKPHSSSDDLALWERIHLIEFPLSFVDNPKAKNERKADKNLLEKLKAERPGILAWLVRGCLGWQKEELNPPETVLLATNNYRDEENKISQFINEQCVQSPDEKVTAGDLYRVYGWWANDKGLPLMSIRKFGLEMQNRFRSEKGRHTIYFGIRLKGVPLIPKKEDA